MEIVANSAKLTVHSTGVVPGVDLTPDGKKAVMHLTMHARPIIAETTYTDKEASAINIRGEVKVRMNPHDEIGNWEFHFIQLARQVYYHVGYAGLAKSKGSLALNYAAPPLIPAKFVGAFCL